MQINSYFKKLQEPEEGCDENHASLVISASSGYFSRLCGQKIPDTITIPILGVETVKVLFTITEFDKKGGTGFRMAYRFGGNHRN